MMTSTTRILIADDHAVLRESLHAFLEKKEWIDVVAEASTGREVLDQVAATQPHIVLMDISMRDLNGVEATRMLQKSDPDLAVIALSVHADEQYVRGMFDAGARGYLLKTCPASEVVTAIEAVRRGRVYLTPEIAHVMVRPNPAALNPQAPSGSPTPDILTGREREVLQLVAEGLTGKEIAARLEMSVKTVETHRNHLLKKLSLHNAVGLTKYALRYGIISLDD